MRLAHPVPSPTLHLLDWNRPLLHVAVPHLASEWDGTGPLDLADQLVVVPTRRAGRRLREALAAHAATRGQAVFPPRVVLPEQLLADALAPQAAASPAEMLVAWIEVLRAIRLADFDAVFPVPPADRGFAWAARLARQLLELQAVLVENGLRIADVPARAGPFPETRRWQQLAELERRHDEHLAAAGLVSGQVARIAAAEVAHAPDGTRRIVVVATLDPQPLVLRRLERLAEVLPVEILIHGPSSDLFDAWGRPLPSAWAHRRLELADFERHVHVLADPPAQADMIVGLARAHDQADGMLGIAVADRDVLAPLHHGLRRVRIQSYDPEGTPRRSGELHRLLELLLALAEEPAFDTVAALARCPAVLAWLGHACGPEFSAATFLAALDRLHAGHLPPDLDSAREHVARRLEKRDDDPAARATAAALAALATLHAHVAAAPFPEGVQTALGTLHRHRRFHVARPEDAALVDDAEAWAGIAHATAEAAARLGRLGARDAWRLALQQFGENPGFEEKPAGALELQGWLELPWEDAPHLVVAGLNDGRVPTAVAGDAFLPEALRERLGLKTNAARLARDACLLHTLVSSRSRHGRLDLLLGRTSAAGDPLRPSRLLLACDDADLPARVNLLFRELPTDPGGSSATAWRRAWRLRPAAPRRIERVSVTGLRAHLACPFRFYLRYGLGMEEVDPHKAELDALDFGNLCHHALEAMGRDPVMRRSADPEALREFLLDRFDRRARAIYGTEVSVPLLVQLESARQRLTHVARVHAAETADGWLIHEVERGFTLTLAGLTVTGRIDRIDRHEPSGRVRVLDYKTFDLPKTPRATHTRPHRAGGAAEDGPPAFACFTAPDGIALTWTDLQLPLYRRALAEEFGHAIEVGYFNLPKAATETALALWDGFDGTWQVAADRCAEGVAAAIAAGEFWPPAEELEFDDEFGTLFHQGTAASIDWSVHTGGAP